MHSVFVLERKMGDEDCKKITKEDLTVIGLKSNFTYLPNNLTYKSTIKVVADMLRDYFTTNQPEYKSYCFENITFKSVNEDWGWLEVICQNVDTVKWITSLEFDSRIKFTTLSDIYKQEPEVFLYFRCQKTELYFRCCRTWKMVAKQNIGLNTNNWGLMFQKDIENSDDQIALVTVDNDSIDYFKKHNWKIYIAMYKCEVKQFQGFLHETFTDKFLKSGDFDDTIIWSDFFKMLKETHDK